MAGFEYKQSFAFRDSHKSYTSLQPTMSKIITRKYDDAKYNFHRKQIARAKPTIDTRAPECTKFQHMKVKLKKIQLEEERKSEIDRDNRLLLQKMSKIMQTSGGLDNQNDYIARSANRRTRQHELLKITQENQAILKRIQSRKPNLDTQALEYDFLSSRQHLAAISRFPPIHGKKARMPVTELTTTEAGEQPAHAQEDASSADAEAST
mmetsp:Transcript_28278/g.74190  ORF Transcript_28278/g.74190 Transcript_28278/m.74190 type:complete len:208 (-) Transcript_28278:285-908(-)|eukprot:CAMPEP_0182924974 /NCGR_PEP_ID=MMETSP0105_2-20130417/8060_1 /TAXON_ID=81532 ORGANISM="Acanthoeca-like sp., Strain 10tr" /NCGR_SAMPLE_ID=MMETSP0105_2 /ASSEMBLY_ACC=CAM_ASM_000205 /LENGTH=207 /DNA_ID=CAMNT_0025062801 /DNA_START=126 /DNA_END=749 /DNA_ORIENTATION=-